MHVKQLLRTHGLPLLGKELIEQAARRRTYVVRVVYAVLLSFGSYLFFYTVLGAARVSPLAVLGQGRTLFLALVCLQFAGIYLFMPAMTCSVITQEKERNSLQLLFLTRLGPWAILFEKLLSRLVPMGGYLLLSLPLLAYCYTLGGISSDIFWTGTWLLSLAAVLMGTLGVACSSFCRTTVGAFVAAYAIAFILCFGPAIAWAVLFLASELSGFDLDRLVQEWGVELYPGLQALGLFPFFGPPMAMARVNFPGSMGFGALVAHSVLVLSASGLFLGVARWSLVRRAFIAPQNLLLELFRHLDRWMNIRTAPASRQQGPLPEAEPVAWRETTKRSLGRGRYLLWLLLIVEVPLLMLCGLAVLSHQVVARSVLGLLQFVFWAFAVLIVSARAASLIAGERSHQTLDVLCTAPLTGREIVLQKYRGVRQLIWALCVPMVTLALFTGWWLALWSNRYTSDTVDVPQYLVTSISAVLIYLPFAAWLSLAIGLRVRTQVRAMIGSLAAIVGWCIGPLLFILLPLSIVLERVGANMGPNSDAQLLLTCVSLLSPATMVFVNEAGTVSTIAKQLDPYVLIALNFGFYGVATIAFRALCLRRADSWLGRAEASLPPTDAEDEVSHTIARPKPFATGNRASRLPLARISSRPGKMLSLLVSVRNGDEARQALAGGCDVLDVKEPSRGAMGMADFAEIVEIAAVRDRLSPQTPLTVALGEARDWQDRQNVPGFGSGVSAFKVGTSGLADDPEFARGLLRVRERIENARKSGDEESETCDWITVAYADWQEARSPSPESVLRFAAANGWGLLIDTFSKSGGGLFERLDAAEIQRLRDEARRCGVLFALAGRLTAEAVECLREIAPDVVGIRSAACRGGCRDHEIDAQAVAVFRESLQKQT